MVQSMPVQVVETSITTSNNDAAVFLIKKSCANRKDKMAENIVVFLNLAKGDNRKFAAFCSLKCNDHDV